MGGQFVLLWSDALLFLLLLVMAGSGIHAGYQPPPARSLGKSLA